MADLDTRPREDAGDVRQPHLGPLGLARFAWRQLTSMRTALFLLLLLAVAAVPGSVLPQRDADPAAAARFLDENPGTGPWLDRLGLLDVYASPWFSAIYLLLFVSLVGCVLPRTRAHLAALRSRPPRTPRRLERMPEHRQDEVDGDVDQVLTAARRVLRSRRFRLRDDGDAVSAERGYLRETGNLAFHLALVGLLVAVATGGLLGYRGQVVVPVGEGFANSLSRYDTFDPGTWFDPVDLPPFRFTLDSLSVSFEESAGGNQFGQPRDFEAQVTLVRAPGDASEQVTLKVNEPISAGGAHIYLAGNGYAPVITVRDGNGDVAYSGPSVFLAQDNAYTSTGVVKVTGARPEQIGLRGTFLPTASANPEGFPVSVFPDARDPVLLLQAYTGDLGLDDGVPESVFSLDLEGLTEVTGDGGRPWLTALRPGQTAQMPDGAGSVTFERVERFAGLTVRSDPTKGAALVFAVLAMLGLVASLFVPRRRVWVRAVAGPAPGRTLVQVAGLARGEDAGLAREVEQVAAALSAPLAAGADVSTGGREH